MTEELIWAVIGVAFGDKDNHVDLTTIYRVEDQRAAEDVAISCMQSVRMDGHRCHFAIASFTPAEWSLPYSQFEAGVLAGIPPTIRNFSAEIMQAMPSVN